MPWLGLEQWLFRSATLAGTYSGSILFLRVGGQKTHFNNRVLISIQVLKSSRFSNSSLKPSFLGALEKVPIFSCTHSILVPIQTPCTSPLALTCSTAVTSLLLVTPVQDHTLAAAAPPRHGFLSSVCLPVRSLPTSPGMVSS